MNNYFLKANNIYVNRKGVIFMDIDSSIKCSVSNCSYHAQEKNYCTLNEIQVGTHESNPTMVECTDCQSFKVK